MPLARRTLLLLAVCASGLSPSPPSRVWVPDNGNGTYRNPVLYADYSDPDVVRVGNDFYLIASSFDAVPGLPILHSTDLVNWTIVGHALAVQLPRGVYDHPQHGNGAWAPSIRYHDGEFYVYYPDPDFGIYLVKARTAAGPWSAPLLVKAAKGWIDPCPLWDDDGRAYLVTAMAASRSGINSVLIVSRLSPDGTRVLDDGTIVFDGHDGNPTVEGPKLYKRAGYYYIFAPAGGVPNGWQLALRSASVYGPYASKVVLRQGTTDVNGPHQGAWVETAAGESWFVHFQDRGAYGRVVHLEPMRWQDDWPVIGNNGEPVATFTKPRVPGLSARAEPQASDEFNDARLGLQWQWQANPLPSWAIASPARGALRLFAIPVPGANLWDAPNVLLQKFPGPAFVTTTKVKVTARNDGDTIGLVIMGVDYAYLALTKRADRLVLTQVVCHRADTGAAEHVVAETPSPASIVYLRATVDTGALASFSYSLDGRTFTELGERFTARPGKWIGAKVGLFGTSAVSRAARGYGDFDWFRVDPH